MDPEPKLPGWLTRNVWAIVAMILAAFQGYNVGTSGMEKMKDQVAELRTREANRRPFSRCVDRRIYHLENKIAGPSPCNVDFPE